MCVLTTRGGFPALQCRYNGELTYVQSDSHMYATSTGTFEIHSQYSLWQYTVNFPFHHTFTVQKGFLKHVALYCHCSGPLWAGRNVVIASSQILLRRKRTSDQARTWNLHSFTDLQPHELSVPVSNPSSPIDWYIWWWEAKDLRLGPIKHK